MRALAPGGSGAGSGAGSGSGAAAAPAPMMSGSIAELARRVSSAWAGVRQSRVSKAPQFSQTGSQWGVDVVALGAHPLRPARGAERLGEPAAHHLVGLAAAALDRRHQREAARRRLGDGEVAERLARAGEVLRGEGELGLEQPALRRSPGWRRSSVAKRLRRASGRLLGLDRGEGGGELGVGFAAQAVVRIFVALRFWPRSACDARRERRRRRQRRRELVRLERGLVAAGGVAFGERGAGVGEREHRVAADADVARQQARVHRGGQRLAGARPVAGLRLEVEEGAQHALVVGAEREGLLGERHRRVGVALLELQPHQALDADGAGAVVGQERLVGLERLRRGCRSAPPPGR